MFPTVVIRQPGQTPIYLSVREPIEVGRECTGVILVDPQVSRRHLVLAPVGDRVAVLDLGSTNGTVLHGRRLEIEIELMAGQFIKLGDTTITVDEPTIAFEPPAAAEQGAARSHTPPTGSAVAESPSADRPDRSGDVGRDPSHEWRRGAPVADSTAEPVQRDPH